jgi:hypothetical protein
MTVKSFSVKRNFILLISVVSILMVAVVSYHIGYISGEMNEKRKWSDFLNRANEEGRYRP